MDMHDTVVIGAGQAGLAAGYYLQRAGLRFTIVEASGTVGGSWPMHYDSLKLFSPARFSSLPGMRMHGDSERYPTRDELVGYLQQYASHFQLPIVRNARVTSVSHREGYFAIQTSAGTYHARSVVAATGSYHRPFTPHLPDQESFAGETVHASAYHTPEGFAGKRVLVVGSGNSAVQIATELARSAQVTLTSRRPVEYVAQRPWGRDIHFWWWLTRFDRISLDSPVGRLIDRLTANAGRPVLDTGVYRAALDAGRPNWQPLFRRFTADGVELTDGRVEAIDAVIFATGYQPNLAYLDGLGALDATGNPLHHQGISTVVSGLGFVGLANQRTLASATVRGVGPDAAVVVRALYKYLRNEQGWIRRQLNRVLPIRGCCGFAT